MATAEDSATAKLTEVYSYQKLFRDLSLHTDVAVKFYGSQRKTKEAFNSIYDLYVKLSELIPLAKKNQEFISAQALHYDFVYANGKRVKGNGYRSILKVFKSCSERLVKHLRACSKEREGMLNSVFGHYKTIHPHVMAFNGMTLVLDMAVCLIKVSCACKVKGGGGGVIWNRVYS